MNTPDTPHTEPDAAAGGAAAPAQAPRVEPVDAGSDDLAVGGNLDKIRTILFGAQTREFERRFARIEERMAKDSAELRAEVGGRVEALEAYVKRELGELSDRIRNEQYERSSAVKEVGAQLRESARVALERLKAEQTERADAVKEVAEELQELGRSLDRRLAQLDEQSAKGQREIREQILDLSKSLGDEIRRRHDDAAAALDKAVGDLRAEKADRAGLASLFTEMSMRLNGEFTIPGGE